MKFVKYSSIGLIIGFGGYACYRLIVKQRLLHHVKHAVLPSVHTDPPSFLGDPVEKKDSSTSITPSKLVETPAIATTTTITATSTAIESNSPSIITETSTLSNENVVKEKLFFTSPSSSLPLNPGILSLQSSDTEQLTPKKTELKEQQKIKDNEVELIDNQGVKELESFTNKGNDEKETKDDSTLNNSNNLDLTSSTNHHESTLNFENNSSISLSRRNGPKEVSQLSNDSPSTTNCSLDVCPSTPCSSPLDVTEYGEMTTESIDCSNVRYLSMTSQSSMLGEGMVAKLEQLLQEAGKLAEDVGEMNADLVTVERKLEPKLLTISADSISMGDETNGDSMMLNGKDECSLTPSLEWDSNGINLLSDADSNHSTIKEEDESLLSESLLSDKSELFSPISSGSLNSTVEEASLFITSIGDLTNNSIDKELSSLQFSTSDANENFV